MTQAQKTAKAKFKQAIAYRQKTGVSLKEAFAHIYGKKVGAVKKKSAPKKKAAKKVAKKKVSKKKITRIDYDKRYQAKKPGKRKSATGKTYYENRTNRSDKGKLLGIGNLAIEKYKNLSNDINKAERHCAEYSRMSKDKGYNLDNRKSFKLSAMKWKKYLSELKTHAKELKKML